MAITRYTPTTDLFRPLFDDFFNGMDASRQHGLLRAPSADVVERENEIEVMLEMPGLRADEIEINLENNVLTIAGEKRETREELDDQQTWHLSERRYGRFSRSFVLPRDVEQDGIHASMENGVLSVVIPKSERARRRRIEIAGSDNREEVGNK